MIGRYQLLSLALVACIITSGCMYVPRGSEVRVSLYGPTNQEPGETPLNPFTVSESEFEVDGELDTGGGAADRSIYRDISIRLYAEDEQLLCSYRVGNWNVSRGRTKVTFSTTHSPHYVVIYSEDFWNEPMTVHYFVFDSDRQQYIPERASSQSELPVSVSDRDAPAC